MVPEEALGGTATSLMLRRGRGARRRNSSFVMPTIVSQRARRSPWLIAATNCDLSCHASSVWSWSAPASTCVQPAAHVWRRALLGASALGEIDDGVGKHEAVPAA